MILYQLKCGAGHQFEAWFRDAAAYDSQSADGEIGCPLCGDTAISKAPMAPYVAKGAARTGSMEEKANEVAQQIFQAAERLRRHVEENCDDVGERFAEEARRIHYGETDERGIYGTATDDEATDLTDEGIEFHRVRWPKRND
ncbi:DUF1178 family protein [Shumkonia mesophila]|uniref:DUF1178 family protein n=1 Tax=Shumkonia mesophila TaxID=2838854 RepID=UPI0029352679|nr:DUF1178 family protein [Shumkonia mesophila]